MLKRKELHALMEKRFGPRWQSKVARLMSEMTGVKLKSARSMISARACSKLQAPTWCEMVIRMLARGK